jgi:hypothetical protein
VNAELARQMKRILDKIVKRPLERFLAAGL